MNIEEFSKRSLLFLPILFLSLCASCAQESIRIKNINMVKSGEDKVKISLFTNKKLDQLEGIQKSQLSLNFSIDPPHKDVDDLKQFNVIDFSIPDRKLEYESFYPRFVEKTNEYWKYEVFIPISSGKGKWTPPRYSDYLGGKHPNIGGVYLKQSYDLSKGTHRILFWMTGLRMWGVQSLNSNKYLYKYKAK